MDLPSKDLDLCGWRIRGHSNTIQIPPDPQDHVKVRYNLPEFIAKSGKIAPIYYFTTIAEISKRYRLL